MPPPTLEPYYAVAIGRLPGVYRTWEECKQMVIGVPSARFKKFTTAIEAYSFIADTAVTMPGIIRRATERGAPPARPLSPPPPPPLALASEEGFVCFTDGACSHNGYAGARAAYAVVFPDLPSGTIAEKLAGPVQTNNRAEYTAAIAALNFADAMDTARAKPITIYTDSKLLIDSVTKWMPGWYRRNWKKSDGTDVANADLLQRIREHTQHRTVVWRYVPAHTGGTDYASYWNNIVDTMAVGVLAATGPAAT